MNGTEIAISATPSRKQQAAIIITAMDQCLDENRFAGPNLTALRRMQELAQQLHGFGGPFGEKPGSIAEWASIFWSERKHRNWDTTAESGADRVRQNMLHDLVSLRSLNSQMQD